MSGNKHIVGLDIGDVWIGVAVSDESRLIASPLDVIRRIGWGPDVKKISMICERYDTKEIVSGLPLNMDGTEGFQAEKVRALCAQLEKSGFNVYYQDERLTTVTAESALIAGGVRRENRKQHVDKVAAAVILQQWLDTARQSQQRTEETQMSENENMENIIELVDEEGNTVSFELLASLERDGKEYIALMVPEDESDAEEDEGEVIFMLVEQDENGEDSYVGVEDEELQSALFDQFLQLMEDMEDEDPEEGELKEDGEDA